MMQHTVLTRLGGAREDLAAAQMQDGVLAAAQMQDGVRAVVGGADYAVGGWGEYEIARRHACHVARGGAEPPGARYGGRTYILATDAVHSVVAQRGAPALQRAALRLAVALGEQEDRLCDPDEDSVWECEPATDLRAGPATDLREAQHAQYLTIPPVTSADLRALASDPAQQNDPLALQELSADIISTAGAVGTALGPLPPWPSAAWKLPPEVVAVTDDEGILRLEEGVAPHIASLEALQAALASMMDAAAAGVERALAAKSARHLGGSARARSAPDLGGSAPDLGSTPRGGEVDAAAARPPPALLALLRSGIPGADGPFDLDASGAVVLADDGIYYGVEGRGDRSRATLLSPGNVAVAALETSGRKYAWIIFDSPEGCYAVRAPPRGGLVVEIDRAALLGWLRPRLGGAPPHKIAAAEYLAHLRSLGLEIREGPPRGDGATRFSLSTMTTDAERAHELGLLRALTPADFAALDWAAYDRDAAAQACLLSREVAGDVDVDLAKGTVAAPKVRPGLIWGAMPHSRSYVTFHTHPAARYRGGSAEPPSVQDVLVTLDSCARGHQAWAFVSAPEGTYVLRPSLALAGAYLRDPEGVRGVVADLYAQQVSNCRGATAACGEAAARALGEAGFIAHLRGAPCAPLLAVPDLNPVGNQMSRAAYRGEFAALAETPGELLLAADWTPVSDLGESPTVRAATWLMASLRGGRVVPTGAGHMFGPVGDPASYPGREPGPLFVVYFPEEDVPAQVPHAALEAARTNAGRWAWSVFLSPHRVTVFRVAPHGVEIHGPVARAGRPEL